MNTADEIKQVCDELCALLQKKNAAYGDSALNPIRIFSKLPPEEGIRVRVDDKLSRLLSGDEKAFGEEPEWDLMGYLVLLRIAKQRRRALALESSGDGAAPSKTDEEGYAIDPSGERTKFERTKFVTIRPVERKTFSQDPLAHHSYLTNQG